MTTTAPPVGSYRKTAKGFYQPDDPVVHRDEEYESEGFDLLLKMQSKHFWYLGRHRFLLKALHNDLKRRNRRPGSLSGIDLGGGCGGWIRYLQDNTPHSFAELALADSSPRALELAAQFTGKNVERFQVDLLNLQWSERWDVVFLLDVLEHIPQDAEALRQIYRALRPGGLLFVTTPALKFFWSYNDELAHHVRRYSRRDYERLAAETGFTHCYSRYFMFFLSPLLLLSRLKRPDLQKMSREEIRDHLAKTHRIPAAPVNRLLHFIFSLEAPLGLKLPFPWGTSILSVLKKPD